GQLGVIEPEIAIHRLDLVEPLVDEPLLRMEAVRVALPGVRDDRGEPRPASLVRRPDRATPAAQVEAAVGRPDAEDRVVRARRGEPLDRTPEVPRPDPESTGADFGEGADRRLDDLDVERAELRVALAPGRDGIRDAPEDVLRRGHFVGAHPASGPAEP